MDFPNSVHLIHRALFTLRRIVITIRNTDQKCFTHARFGQANGSNTGPCGRALSDALAKIANLPRVRVVVILTLEILPAKILGRPNSTDNGAFF